MTSPRDTPWHRGAPGSAGSAASSSRWEEDAFGRRSLSRSTTDRDAVRRGEPGLLDALAADPATRVLLVDVRGRVALDGPATHADFPQNGLTPPSGSIVSGAASDPAAPSVASVADSPSVPAGAPGAEPEAARPDHAVVEGAETGTEPEPGRSAEGPTNAASASRAGAPTPRRPRLAPLTAADLRLDGLETYYLGREVASGDAERPGEGGPGDGDATRDGDAIGDGDGTGAGSVSWIAAVVPDGAGEPLDAEGSAHPHRDLTALLRRYPLSALRAVGEVLTSRDAGLATPAVALAGWHARSAYCPTCGTRTEIVQAGWARRCPGCGTVHFPRTDAAVIMAVTDDADRIVLVHGATWDAHRFSTVAGFIEAGEPAEAAVVREVSEEVGLRVESVELVATQPWPFPRSLMLGFRARLAPGGARPVVDGVEVTDAVVLSRAELAAAIGSGEVVLPGATSIARMLIEDWYGGPLPD